MKTNAQGRHLAGPWQRKAVQGIATTPTGTTSSVKSQMRRPNQ